MCFGNANKEDPDAKKNREIEKQLREDERRMQKEVKLLLLGMDCAGNGMVEHILITSRCGRVRQVDSVEADALDTHQGLPATRTQAMEGHHLPESAACLPSGLRRYGGAGGGLCG